MRKRTDHTYSRTTEVQNVLGEGVHKVSQGGIVPEWSESGLFKGPTAARKFDCGRSVDLSDIPSDGPEDFVDLGVGERLQA